jgi:hypothetical protein
VEVLREYVKFQKCPVSEVLFTISDLRLENATGWAKFGMNAMGAVEHDFECAAMCSTSVFYTFSNVTNGPPF